MTCKQAYYSQKKPAMKWISVEDRLPENNTDYLIYSQGEVFVCRYWGNIGKWLSGDARCSNNQLVTHWMPLPPCPEPPKGDK